MNGTMTTATRIATTYVSECSACLGRSKGWVANCTYCGCGRVFVVKVEAK